MTVFFPGTHGGAQWGGTATDPDGVMYVQSKEVPVYTSLVPRRKSSDQKQVAGSAQYMLYCSACHGADQKGNHDGSYPSLLQIGDRIPREMVTQVMLKGRGMMPSFSHISEAERVAVVNFLFNKTSEKPVVTPQKDVIPYQHTGYNRWYDRNGYPVSSPSWGTLSAIDLNTGDRLWQVPPGEYAELTKKEFPLREPIIMAVHWLQRVD
ncbi:c-type cytochrome [Dyadobacter sp. CY312]|nr:cytochrome c [Dyadobacter sp. CY312]MCE7042817.1 c-type cytochrome [Dyadobacter sp. CY312]